MMKGLPEGWRNSKIKDIGSVITGNTPPKNNAENYGGNLPWIKPPNLDNGMFVSTSNEKISEIGRKKVRLLPKGSVLVSCIGNIGKVAIAECDLCTNQQINSIIPNKEIVDSIFLYYLIKKIKPNLENVASSFVVPLLNKKAFSNIEIPLPPLPVQKKIAGILEKAEKLKTWRAEADKLTDEFLKSTFLEMFGDPSVNSKHWTTKKLREISEIKTGGTPSRKNDDYWQNGNIPWIKTTEIKNNVIYVAQEYITEKGFDQSNVSIIPNNSILIAMYGQGKTRGRVSKLGIDATINQACAAILPSTKYEPDFILYFLKSSYEKLRSLGRGGNQPNLNLTMVKNFEVYCPPLPLQQKFAAIVGQVEQMRHYQQESKAHIDDLFNALMQKAFKGELVA